VFFNDGMQQYGVPAPLLMAHCIIIIIINSEFYLLSRGEYQHDIGTFFSSRKYFGSVI
jgi:hypothetical protein